MNINQEELKMLEASLTLLAGSTTSLLLLLNWKQILRKYKKIFTRKKTSKGVKQCK